MPSSSSYPGVYIEEISSGVHAVTGVATSITAFIGFCPLKSTKSTANEPITVNSWGDYQRVFGGLSNDSMLGFAVQDFFDNGGGQAIIVNVCSNKLIEEEEEYKNNRVSLKSVAEVAKILKLPKNYTIGKAIGGGGCFFDSLAQALNANSKLNADSKTNKYTEQSLRFLCYNYLDPGVVKDTELTIDNFQWGRSSIEGVILCRQLNLEEIYVYEIEKKPADDNEHPYDSSYASPYAWKITKTSVVKTETNKVDLSKPSLIVGAKDLDLDLHFVPILPFDKIDKINESNCSTNAIIGDKKSKIGLYALDKVSSFNLLCIPPYIKKDDNSWNDVENAVWNKAAKYCEERRAFLLIDSPSSWTSKEKAKEEVETITKSKNAAIFFPQIKRPNQTQEFVPCGMIAGMISRIDASRGLWKAPAGLESYLRGVTELTVPLTDAENGELNQLGINCLRIMPGAGPVVWGARTLEGNDSLASEWKYIPVRRLALYLEESLYRGLKWVVFEPNDEPLWNQIILNLNSFMYSLFRQGAFKGMTRQEAYFVKCDKEINTQDDIDKGKINILVGFAPLKPAEFVVLQLQQVVEKQI